MRPRAIDAFQTYMLTLVVLLPHGLSARPLAMPMMPSALYNAAAGSLATRAVLGAAPFAGTTAVMAAAGLAPAEAAVLGSTALALLLDFGPSAARDLSTSNEASRLAAEELIEASGPMVLVDNFVQNLGAENDDDKARKAAMTARLTAANDWAFLVRARILADATGVLLMMRGRSCLGAAVLLAAHAAYWAAGAAGARLDRQANAAPLSPPLAVLIGATTAVLSVAAATGALGPNAAMRAAGSRVFSYALVAIQTARVVADRVRERTHVGL